MVEFKACVADPASGKTYSTAVTGHGANQLIGKKLGDEFDGIFVGLPGYKLRLTGGSDGTGTPMRPDLTGPRKYRILTAESLGFHPAENGVRKRRTLRGNTVGPELVQINVTITSQGSKKVAELLAKKAEGEEPSTAPKKRGRR